MNVALLHVERGPGHHKRVANYLLEHQYNKFLHCCKANVQLSVFFANLLQNDTLRAVKSGQVLTPCGAQSPKPSSSGFPLGVKDLPAVCYDCHVLRVAVLN